MEDQHFYPFLVGTDVNYDARMGVLPDLVLLAAKASGVEVELVRKPWKRCQQEVKTGTVDGLFAFIYSEERDTWVAYPKTDGVVDNRYAYLSQYAIFSQPDSQLSWDGNELLPKTALVQSVPGYITEQKLFSMGFMAAVNMQPKDGLAMVAKSRIDGYVVDEVIGQNLAVEQGFDTQLTTLPIPFLSQPWYVAFSKQRYAEEAEAVESFWSALALVREKQGAALFEYYRNAR